MNISSINIPEGKDRIKENLKSWIYTIIIFFIVLLILFPLLGPFLTLTSLPIIILIGFISAFFSAYILTPWSLRKKIKPFKDATPEIINALKDLSEKAGLKKMPELMIKETPEINALTYTSLSSHYICLTRGLVDAYKNGSVDHDEFRAILGHEMGHIISRDTLKFSITISWPSIFDNIGTFILLTGLATNEAGIIYSKEASSEEDRGAAALILLFGLLILI